MFPSLRVSALDVPNSELDWLNVGLMILATDDIDGVNQRSIPRNEYTGRLADFSRVIYSCIVDSLIGFVSWMSECTRRLQQQQQWWYSKVIDSTSSNIKQLLDSVLSCLLTVYTAVMSFEILFPFGLWVSEPGWLLIWSVPELTDGQHPLSFWEEQGRLHTSWL